MMHDEIAAAFAALSPRAKIMVLARTIHMETIHIREAHLDDPTDAGKLYQSSEFIHRLTGCIMSIACEPTAGKSKDYMASVLIEGVQPRGAAYLCKLADWIIEVEALQ